MGWSDAYITNDGGPGHFAANSNAFSFYKPLSCSPCLTAYNHRNSPCDGDNICLKRISPEEVLVKAFEMLESQEYNN